MFRLLKTIYFLHNQESFQFFKCFFEENALIVCIREENQKKFFIHKMDNLNIDFVEFLTLPDNYYPYSFNKGFLYIMNESITESKLFDIEKNEFSHFYAFTFLTVLSNYLIGHKSEDGNSYINLIDEEKNIKWKKQIPSLFRSIDNELYNLLGFNGFNKSIQRLSFDTGDPLWTLDVSEVCKCSKNIMHEDKIIEGHITKLIGVYQGLLIMACSNHILLIVDNETGVIINEYRTFKLNKTDKRIGSKFISERFGDTKLGYGVITNVNKSILLEEEGKIIGLDYFLYWEIDLETKEAKLYHLEEEFSSLSRGLGSSRNFVVDGEYVYFLSYSPSAFGVFNRKQKKPIWMELIDEEEVGVLHSIHYYDGRVYISAGQGNLLIFEKTKLL